MNKEDLTRDDLLIVEEITMNKDIKLSEEIYESNFFKSLVEYIEKEINK